MNSKNKDNIYTKPIEKISDFTFDEKVASVFPDMIKRSVPGYGTIVSMVSVFAREFAQKKSLCYDLGCSLGAVTLALRHGIREPDCSIVAIDNSPAMIQHCKQHLDFDSSNVPVKLVCGDIENIAIKNASIVVLNFTLQFIKPKKRLALLEKIYRGMLPGGVLILSEKIAFSNQSRQKLHNELHHSFKRANGYSDLEISQKRTALEKVLIPETISTHQTRLITAGFLTAETWFQCFNFISLLAFK